MEVCAHAGNATEAADLIERLAPALILMDLPPRRAEALREVQQVRASSPQVKLLVLSNGMAAPDLNRLLRAGADGWAAREDLELVADAIRDVLSGYLFISEQAAGRPGRPAKRSCEAAWAGIKRAKPVRLSRSGGKPRFAAAH